MGYYTMWLAYVKSYFVPFWELERREASRALGQNNVGSLHVGIRGMGEQRLRHFEVDVLARSSVLDRTYLTSGSVVALASSAAILRLSIFVAVSDWISSLARYNAANAA